MSQQYHGRLELTWTNKDGRLLSGDDGSYTWLSPADYRVAEVRLLHNAETFGQVSSDRNRARDNLLIRGDALYGLTSLAQLPEFAAEYAGKVRLAYLDPPFNTQQSFLHYDDALEHSVWLTMMRDRLLQIRELLSSRGSVWVHCDDSEQHRLRCVLDEVFGSQSYIGTIAWLKSDSPRSSARFFSTDQDYIHVYARDPEQWRPNKLARTEAVNAKYLNPDNDPRGPWVGGNLRANKPYSVGRYVVTGPTGRQFTPPPGKYWRISKENFDRLQEEGRIWWGKDGSALPTLKRFLSEVSVSSRERPGHTRRSGRIAPRAMKSRRFFPASRHSRLRNPSVSSSASLTLGAMRVTSYLTAFLGLGPRRQ